MSKPVTYDHLRSMKKPVTKSIRIATDSDIAADFEEAKGRYELTKFVITSQPDNPQAADDLAKAEEAYRQAKEIMLANSVKFTFRSIGRRKYEGLVTEHPRTDEQKAKDAASGIQPGQILWNDQTFPAALIAASCIDPVLTPENVAEMFDSEDWSEAELASLFGAALDANVQARVVDLGKG